MTERHFGVYFFSWYERAKWEESPRRRSPLIGEYDSDDPAVLAWQFDQIKQCGFDYVVFELLPLDNWCARRTLDTIARAIPLLQARNLAWSFLLDADVLADAEKQNALEPLTALVEYLEAQDWQDGLVAGPTDKPLLLVFKPLPTVAGGLLQRYGDRYDLYFAVQFTHWDIPDPTMLVEADRPFLLAAYEQGRTLESELLPLHYVGFWQPPGTVKNYHGICPVVPSYDDLLLARDPQVTPTIRREDGQTYFRQFCAAVDSGASHILVYGWNEYFEEVTIEPATGYGNYYCELTREFINQARHGRPLCYLPRQNLSEARKNIPGTRQQYTWDLQPQEKRQERFAAAIEVAVAERPWRSGSSVWVEFAVRNRGLRPWLCKTAKMPIRLGVRLLAANGQVVRELRAADFDQDVLPGETRTGRLLLETAGLDMQGGHAEFNLVYEQRFWFDAASTVILRPSGLDG